MAQVLDLRGRRLVPDRTPVLLDPSGGRARVLAWVGRAVAVVFLVWLIGLVFAGLGLLPSGDLPFGRAFVGQSTPMLKSMPPITQPEFAGPSAAAQSAAAARFGHPTSSSGVAAAASRDAGTSGATSGGSGARAGSGAPASRGNGHGSAGATNGSSAGSSAGSGAGSGASGGSVTSGASSTATSGASSSANNGLHAGGAGPGRTVSQSSPGHTKSSGTEPAAGSGSSSASSGHGHQTTTTSTTPGKSGSAPGHAPFG